MKIKKQEIAIGEINCDEIPKLLKDRVAVMCGDISSFGIDCALELYPIVVKPVGKRFQVVAGHRTFLLLKSSKRSSKLVHVSVIDGKDSLAGLLPAADALLGPLMFSMDARELQDLVKPFLADGSHFRVSNELINSENFQKVLKPQAKKAGRKPAAGERFQKDAIESRESEGASEPVSGDPSLESLAENPSATEQSHSEPSAEAGGTSGDATGQAANPEPTVKRRRVRSKKNSIPDRLPDADPDPNPS